MIRLDSIENIPVNSIAFCSFDGQSLWALTDLKSSDLDEIEIHYSQLQENETSKEEYLDQFELLIQSLKDKRLEKVVLSKLKLVEKSARPGKIFDELNATYSNTFNYLLSSTELGCWMGATPELLLESDGKIMKSVSLAGTVLQNEKWSDKERREQALVTEYIVSKLQSSGSFNIITKGPFDIENGIVKHLKTEIACVASQDDFLKTLSALHPTPATCGLPTNEAKELILQTEKHDRKLYTGFILLNFENPIAFVNLRCMELSETKAQLYLGGGLLENSDPQKEWEETERKAQTLINVLM